MSTIKTILSVLAIVAAYGVVGRMDYDDAVMMESAYKEVAQTDCLRDVSDSSLRQNQPVQTVSAGITDEAVTDGSDRCDVRD